MGIIYNWRDTGWLNEKNRLDQFDGRNKCEMIVRKYRSRLLAGIVPGTSIGSFNGAKADAAVGNKKPYYASYRVVSTFYDDVI